jgi:hypothetical protein
MVGIVPCTLELGSQHPSNMDVVVEKGPKYQHKRPQLMSSAGREIVGPGYVMVRREIHSGTKAGCDARRGREANHKGKGHEAAARLVSVTKNTAPGAKPAPRWCPAGLTKTHC